MSQSTTEESILSSEYRKEGLERSGLGDTDDALMDLKRTSRLLSRLSDLAGYLTLAHLAGAILLIIYTMSMSLDTYTSSYPRYNKELYIVLEIMFLLINIIVLFSYDRKIAKGDALYQEISDELEWHVRTELGSKRNSPSAPQASKDRPGLFVRLTLRDFVLASRLPFVRGSQGLAFYLAFNVLLTLAVLITFVSKPTK